MAELNFNVGFSLLKSEKLEQRVQGIKEIIEQIKGTKFSVRKTLNAKQVMQKLK
jgi:predicted SpoU family rRNA methylase